MVEVHSRLYAITGLDWAPYKLKAQHHNSILEYIRTLIIRHMISS